MGVSHWAGKNVLLADVPKKVRGLSSDKMARIISDCAWTIHRHDGPNHLGL